MRIGETAISDAIMAAKAKVVEMRVPATARRAEAEEAGAEEEEAEVLSELEVKRLETIMKNQVYLEALGLCGGGCSVFVYTQRRLVYTQFIAVYTQLTHVYTQFIDVCIHNGGFCVHNSHMCIHNSSTCVYTMPACVYTILRRAYTHPTQASTFAASCPPPWKLQSRAQRGGSLA